MDISLESPRSSADHTSARVARAIWFGRPGQVDLRQEPLAAVGPTDVRVKALYSAISHGTEMLVYRGQVDQRLALDLPTLKGAFAFPIKYGYASVGRIDEAGSDVRNLHPGDLVFVHHPHQSEYVVPAASAIPLATGTSPEHGVFLANVETALNIMLDAHLPSGAQVVILGQGVVGLLVTQLLRHAGAAVIAVDPIPRRRQLALALGAAAAIEPGEDVSKEVMDRTDGQGVPVAIEVSGNPKALAQAIECLAFQGTVVAASWYGMKPVALDLGGRFHRNRLRIVSSQVSHVDPGLAPEWTMARRTERARDLVSNLTLTPLISHRFPLEQARDAYRLLDERPDEAVQVLFTYV